MSKKIKGGVRIERLSRAMMRRSMRLLNMEYKPSEIADELKATKPQVMRLITAGAPVRKDAGGHFWINGKSFVEWLENAAPKKPKDKAIFADNECYCLQCRRVVTFTETTRRQMIVFGLCQHGHKVSRFSTKEKGKIQHEKTIQKSNRRKAAVEVIEPAAHEAEPV